MKGGFFNAVNNEPCKAKRGNVMKKTVIFVLSLVLCVGLFSVSKAMAEKIDGEKGCKVYHHRIAIVEPVFANIQTNKRMEHFT